MMEALSERWLLAELEKLAMRRLLLGSDVSAKTRAPYEATDPNGRSRRGGTLLIEVVRLLVAPVDQSHAPSRGW